MGEAAGERDSMGDGRHDDGTHTHDRVTTCHAGNACVAHTPSLFSMYPPLLVLLFLSPAREGGRRQTVIRHTYTYQEPPRPAATHSTLPPMLPYSEALAIAADGGWVGWTRVACRALVCRHYGSEARHLSGGAWRDRWWWRCYIHTSSAALSRWEDGGRGVSPGFGWLSRRASCMGWGVVY